MAELSLVKICCEFKERAPFFYTTLMTAGIPPSSKKKDLQWLPSVAAAGSIILKERCRLPNSFHALYEAYWIQGYVEHHVVIKSWCDVNLL